MKKSKILLTALLVGVATIVVIPFLKEMWEERKQDNKQVKIEIIGHTDNQGSKAYNLDLSHRRANALMNALIRKGISADRLTAKGMGSEAPIATNDTEEGRAQNRRVEIIIQ